MPKLQEAIFSITNRCNLRCRMCDIPFNKTEELTTDELKKAIKDLSMIGARTVVFSGGEPLLREDIFDLISFARSNHLNACITSNGALIDKETASKLKKAGVNVVNISVEGNKKAHEYLRGEGNFDKAVLALENLKECGVESTVASTVSRYNYEFLPEVMDLAKEKGSTTVRFQPFSRIFLKDSSREKEFLINREESDKMTAVIEEIIKKASEYGISTNPVNYLRNIPGYLSGRQLPLQNGCSALWTSCPINSKGDLFPCWVVTESEKLIGNIKHDKLLDLWFSEKHGQIRNKLTKEGCPGCMMSCYDGIFETGEYKAKWVKVIGKMAKTSSYRKIPDMLLQSVKGELAKLKARLRFYRSYNGSLKKVFVRAVNKINRGLKVKNAPARVNVNKLLSEIRAEKDKIEKEISKCR